MGLYDSSPSASALGGAATGAATGASVGSIVPGIGTAAGAVGGAVLGLVGNLIGASSQNHANKLNAQIARETNRQNYQMFREGLDYNTLMWNKTNEWNSPANQRKLLEQAGYNPAILNQNASVAQNMSAPNGIPAQVGHEMRPTVNSQFGSDIANITTGLLSTVADTRLKDAQATAQNIDNLYKGRINSADLALKGDQHTANAIANEVAYAQRDDLKQHQRLQNNVLSAEQRNLIASAMVNEVLTKYHNAKVGEVLESINLLIDQQNETKARAKMEDALGNKHLADAEFSRIQTKFAPLIAQSQINANNAAAEAARATASNQYAMASYNASMGTYQDMVNQLYSKYGDSETLNRLLNLCSQTDLNNQQVEELKSTVQKLNKDVNFYEMNMLINAVHAGMGLGSLPLILLKGKSGKSSPRQQGGIR